MIKKIRQQAMAKSVRASLTMNQKPCAGRESSGILVVAIAVEMMTSSGTDASRVTNPISTRNPHTISKTPTT